MDFETESAVFTLQANAQRKEMTFKVTVHLPPLIWVSGEMICGFNLDGAWLSAFTLLSFKQIWA